MITPHIRTLQPYIQADLATKMVFLGGPRQVGKTTLSKMLGTDLHAPTYLNWDKREHRQAILKSQYS